MIASTAHFLPSASRKTTFGSSRLWFRTRAAAVALAFGFAALAAQADRLLLAQSYKATGKNPDGSSYTGTVSVTVISETTYTVEWKIDGAVMKGFGMRMGDTLSATYMLDGQPGLIIYKVEEDGTLNGTWAIKGENGAGVEVLKPR